VAEEPNMRRCALALLAAAAALFPVTAEATGSGGAFGELQYLPKYGRPSDPHEAPGWLACAGAVGYGVNRDNLRIGAEAAWCRALDGGQVQMNYGGLQVGRWYRAGFLYVSFHGSLGFGSLVDKKVLAYQDDPYVSVFFYGKPTFSLGLPLGFMGLETGVFANFPINLAQFVGSTGQSRGLVNPTVGFQVSLTFGSFKDPKPKRSTLSRPSTAPVVTVPVTPVVPPTTAAPKVWTTPPDPCAQGGKDCPTPSIQSSPATPPPSKPPPLAVPAR
jgi:hypothetical protein